MERPKFLLLLLKLLLLLLNSCSKGLDVISRRGGGEHRSSLPQQHEAGRDKETYPSRSVPEGGWDLRACSHKLPLGNHLSSFRPSMRRILVLVSTYMIDRNGYEDSGYATAVLWFYNETKIQRSEVIPTG